MVDKIELLSTFPEAKRRHFGESKNSSIRISCLKATFSICTESTTGIQMAQPLSPTEIKAIRPAVLVFDNLWRHSQRPRCAYALPVQDL